LSSTTIQPTNSTKRKKRNNEVLYLKLLLQLLFNWCQSVCLSWLFEYKSTLTFILLMYHFYFDLCLSVCLTEDKKKRLFYEHMDGVIYNYYLSIRTRIHSVHRCWERGLYKYKKKEHSNASIVACCAINTTRIRFEIRRINHNMYMSFCMIYYAVLMIVDWSF
jgi:hypothetical protein